MKRVTAVDRRDEHNLTALVSSSSLALLFGRSLAVSVHIELGNRASVRWDDHG